MKRDRSEFFSANQRHNTRGFNIVTLTLNLLLLGLLLVAVLRIVPSYMEYLTSVISSRGRRQSAIPRLRVSRICARDSES